MSHSRRKKSGTRRRPTKTLINLPFARGWTGQAVSHILQIGNGVLNPKTSSTRRAQRKDVRNGDNPAKDGAYLRRRSLATEPFQRVALRSRRHDEPYAKHKAQYLAYIRRNGHGYGGTPCHRHGAGGRDRRDPPQFGAGSAGAAYPSGEEVRIRYGRQPSGDHSSRDPKGRSATYED